MLTINHCQLETIIIFIQYYNIFQLIYDGKLSQSLLFTYNPKAVDGEICLESSPSENPSCFYHSPHALMMDVSVYSCHWV